MTTLPNGFYTALGTPLDDMGNVLADSLTRQIHLQIAAGAAGFLVLGSMGMQASVKQDQCPVAVAAALAAIRSARSTESDLTPVRPEKRVLLAGVMDNSIERVLQRVDSLADMELDGVVSTTPYYSVCGEAALERFFKKIADRSPFPLYLYDLPGVTKMKITLPLVRCLAAHPNIRGIKTGDIVLARSLWTDESLRETFSTIFSGLDIFDVAASFGVTRFLDGMFACCPKTSKRTFELFAAGHIDEGGKCLQGILDLRDTMFRFGIYPAFTVTMNLLGCEGNHGPDYEPEAIPEAWDVLRRKMADMGEIEI